MWLVDINTCLIRTQRLGPRVSGPVLFSVPASEGCLSLISQAGRTLEQGATMLCFNVVKEYVVSHAGQTC